MQIANCRWVPDAGASPLRHRRRSLLHEPRPACIELNVPITHNWHMISLEGRICKILKRKRTRDESGRAPFEPVFFFSFHALVPDAP